MNRERKCDITTLLYIYYNGILSSIKKKEILQYKATGMNLEDIMHAEIGQSQQEMKGITSLLCEI